MKPGAGHNFQVWCCMTAPAILFIATRFLFRGAAALVVNGFGDNAPLAQTVADLLSLAATVLVATTFYPDEIAIAKGTYVWNGRRTLQCVAMGIATGLAVHMLERRLGIHDDTESGILPFIVLCVIGPFAEEIIYRGMVYERGRALMSENGTILVSSVLFAVSHGTPIKMVLAAAAGLLLGWAKRRHRTLLAPFLIHSIINSVNYICLYHLE